MPDLQRSPFRLSIFFLTFTLLLGCVTPTPGSDVMRVEIVANEKSPPCPGSVVVRAENESATTTRYTMDFREWVAPDTRLELSLLDVGNVMFQGRLHPSISFASCNGEGELRLEKSQGASVRVSLLAGRFLVFVRGSDTQSISRESAADNRAAFSLVQAR